MPARCADRELSPRAASPCRAEPGEGVLPLGAPGGPSGGKREGPVCGQGPPLFEFGVNKEDRFRFWGAGKEVHFKLIPPVHSPRPSANSFPPQFLCLQGRCPLLRHLGLSTGGRVQLRGGLESWAENGRLSRQWPQSLPGHSTGGESLARKASIYLVTRYHWAAPAWPRGQWSHSPPHSPCELSQQEDL